MANNASHFPHGYDTPEIDPKNMGTLIAQDNLDWDFELIEDRLVKNEELVVLIFLRNRVVPESRELRLGGCSSFSRFGVCKPSSSRYLKNQSD